MGMLDIIKDTLLILLIPVSLFSPAIVLMWFFERIGKRGGRQHGKS